MLYPSSKRLWLLEEAEIRKLLEDVEKKASFTPTQANDIRKRCLSLHEFVREAWRHIPELANVEYVDGWHIVLICAHLEAITSGRLLRMGLQNRLLVNVPPGMMKSLLVSVFWPAWEWGRTALPLQYITTSFREQSCRRDTRRMRDLCMSEWYQELYGKDCIGQPTARLVGSRAWCRLAKTRISNTAGGWREGVPFGSLTNQRGDRVIIDDPHSTKTAEFEAYRDETTRLSRRPYHPRQRSDQVGDRHHHAAFAR